MRPLTVESSSPRPAAALALSLVLGFAGTASAQSAAGAVFSTRCSSCHTFGKGDRIGPDLKGVTGRRARSWIVDWIRSSTRMIKAADPTARALFTKYREQRMPDFDLPLEQVTAIVD